MSTVVRRGAIRLDVTRAAANVRDNLLAEPAAWLSEVVRAAKLSHATRVDISYDSDDLRVSWDGDPWRGEDLATLETHVFSDRATERRVELLARAVFAALGHEAKWVEVFARGTDDAITAARYERSSLDGAPGEAHPHPIEHRATHRPPHDLPAIALHAKRAPSLGVLARFFTHDAPPEVALLEGRLSSDAVPVFVDGSRVEGSLSEPVLTVPVDAPPFEDVSMLVLDRTRRPEIAFYELGVLLAVVPWENACLAGGLGDGAPLRIRVHADELPTNVSRSKVRDEVFASVVRGATAALPTMVRMLAESAAEARQQSPDDARTMALEDALGALAAVRFRGGWARTEDANLAATALAPLLEMPLLMDATGHPRSMADLACFQPFHIFKATRPLDPNQAAATSDVFWDRGRRADAVLAGGRSFATIEHDVVAGVARRAKVSAVPTEPLAVPRPHDALASATRHDPDGFVVDMVVRARAGQSAARIWIDGRPFGTVTYPQDGSYGPSFDAAVSWPTGLFADRRYEQLSEQCRFTELRDRLHAITLDILGAEAPRLLSQYPRDMRLLLARNRAAARHPVLRELPAWPALQREPVSTREVQATALREGGFRVVSSEEAADLETKNIHLPPSPVYVLDGEEREALSTLILGLSADAAAYGTELASRSVRYAPWLLVKPADLEGTRRALAGVVGGELPIATFKGANLIGACTFAERSGIIQLHRSRIISRSPIETPCLAIALESESTIPITGTNVELTAALRRDLELACFDVFLAAVEGGLDLRGHPHVRAGMRDIALTHIAVRGSRRRVEALPLFGLWVEGVEQCVTVGELVQRFPEGIPSVDGEEAREERATCVVTDLKSRSLLRTLTRIRLISPARPANPEARRIALEVLDKLDHAPPVPPHHQDPPRGDAPHPDAHVPSPLDPASNPKHSGFFDELARLFGEPAGIAPSLRLGVWPFAARVAVPPTAVLELVADGPPVSYVAVRTTIRICPAHPEIVALLRAGDAVSVLAAALAEIDRALEAVTAAHQAAAIAALLEALP